MIFTNWEQYLRWTIANAKGKSRQAAIFKMVFAENINFGRFAAQWQGQIVGLAVEDDEFGAKISDFGVAKVVKATIKGGIVSMPVIAGSYGYIAPEHAYTLHVNEKSDIYSFGVVILELVTGKRPVGPELGEKDLATWVRTTLNEKGVDQLLYQDLNCSIKEHICKVLDFGIRFLNHFRANRLSILRVVTMVQEFVPYNVPEMENKNVKMITSVYVTQIHCQKNKNKHIGYLSMYFVLATLRWYHWGEIEFGPQLEYLGWLFGDELEVYISHRVSLPDHTQFELEYVPSISDNGVSEEHLNPINEGDASNPNFQPSTLTFSSNPPDEPPSSNIPFKSFDPSIDEDSSDDDLENDSDLEGNTSWDSDIDNDVYQEYINIRASKRHFNMSQRRSRGTIDEQVNVGEKGPDIEYDESNVSTRDSLVGKLGGDEPYYLSDKALIFELNVEVGWGYGEDSDEVVRQLFLKSKYKYRISQQSNIRVVQLQEIIRKELDIHVSTKTMRIARSRVLLEIMGDHIVKYGRIFYYRDEILRTNPGSTCIVKVGDADEIGQLIFQGFYVCFHALKKAFFVGTRRLNGLDGCFLKGVQRSNVGGCLQRWKQPNAAYYLRSC
ncbi:hypothetical protein FXO38_04787 [Capsicum annuum]|nr:hypothetical protein FXO38_04787 [Capsicum annuum]KAF3678225.1 hypothetical protein FXO37_04495 [Capsicum annuum]